MSSTFCNDEDLLAIVRENDPADSLPVTCENQRDNASSDVGVVGRRIGRCTVR